MNALVVNAFNAQAWAGWQYSVQPYTCVDASTTFFNALARSNTVSSAAAEVRRTVPGAAGYFVDTIGGSEIISLMP